MVNEWSPAMRTAPLLMLGLLFTAACPLGLAGWPTDSNVNLQVTGGAGEETVPKVAAMPDGGVYIACFDNTGGGYKVRLQQLDRQGNKLFGAEGLLVSSYPQSTSLVDWDLIADAAGNAVLTFTDTRAGSDLDVYAYCISPDGDQLWGTAGVTLSSNNDYEPSPRVCQNTDGDYVFVWPRIPEAGPGAIVMQKLDASGQPLFGPAGIEIPGGLPQERPAFCDLVPADNGAYIVLWVRDTRTFTSPRHVRAQKFHADGSPAWLTYTNVFDATSVPIAYYPTILPDEAGGAVIGWHRSQSNLHSSFAQHLNGAGLEMWPHNGVELSTRANFHHIDPAFAYDTATGETYGFWDERNSAQSQWGTYGQKLSSAGARQWGANGIEYLPVTPIYKWALRVTLVSHSIVATFFEQPAGTTFDIVRALRVHSGGGFVWPAQFETVSSVPSDKGRLPVVVRPDGVTVAVWEDSRDGGINLYAQNLNPNGTVGNLGDLDCDGDLDFGDINPFVLALSNPAVYPEYYPACNMLLADIDGDGFLYFSDINPFIALLSNP
jgi:hypothetical protein